MTACIQTRAGVVEPGVPTSLAMQISTLGAAPPPTASEPLKVTVAE